MTFTFIQKETPYSHWELLQVETGDRLRVVPERGGLITEWRCKGQEILYFDLERFLRVDKSVRGGVPILFPLCGDLPGNSLILEKGNFTIFQHGFARDSVWEIKPLNEKSGFVMSFSDNEQSRSSYPYSFLIEINIHFLENAIDFSISIKNNSDNLMPFSFGLHPYFNVTDLGQTKIIGLDSTGLDHMTMEKVQTKKQLSHLAKGVDFISGPSELVTIIDLVSGRKIHLHNTQPLDLTVIWTDPPRPMVCLEPWTSPRGSLIGGERVLSLESGASKNLSWKISAE